MAVVAVIVAVLAPAVTLTLAGTLKAGELLASVTVSPPIGAALLKATVHWLDANCSTLDGLQDIEEIRTVVLRLIVTVAELVPSVAVSVALWSLAIVVVLTVKTAEAALAATVTEVGA